MSIVKFKNMLRDYGFTYYRRAKGSHAIWCNANGEQFAFSDNGKDVRRGIVWQFRKKYC